MRPCSAERGADFEDVVREEKSRSGGIQSLSVIWAKISSERILLLRNMRKVDFLTSGISDAEPPRRTKIVRKDSP